MYPTYKGAFAAQAKADMGVFDLLVKANAGECHVAHALQMWLEMLAKTKLWSTDPKPGEDRRIHDVAELTLRLWLVDRWPLATRQPQPSKLKQMCRDIDNIHPSTKHSPVNAEYPWLSGVGYFAPCDHRFPVVGTMLSTPDGKAMLAVCRVFTNDPAEHG